MNLKLLSRHVKLCKRNLLSKRVTCCASCPFEEEITKAYPAMKKLFVAKRNTLKGKQ